MIVGLALCVGLFWAGIFLLFFHASGTSLSEVLWGPFEAPPTSVDVWIHVPPGALDYPEEASDPKWCLDHGISPAACHVEQRILLKSGQSGVLVRQQRCRIGPDGPVAHVFPEQQLRRKRTKR